MTLLSLHNGKDEVAPQLCWEGPEMPLTFQGTGQTLRRDGGQCHLEGLEQDQHLSVPENRQRSEWQEQ